MYMLLCFFFSYYFLCIRKHATFVFLGLLLLGFFVSYFNRQYLKYLSHAIWWSGENVQYHKEQIKGQVLLGKPTRQGYSREGINVLIFPPFHKEVCQGQVEEHCLLLVFPFQVVHMRKNSSVWEQIVVVPRALRLSGKASCPTSVDTEARNSCLVLPCSSRNSSWRS